MQGLREIVEGPGQNLSRGPLWRHNCKTGMQCFVLFCNVLHFICMLSGPDSARIYILAWAILYQESLRAFGFWGSFWASPVSAARHCFTRDMRFVGLWNYKYIFVTSNSAKSRTLMYIHESVAKLPRVRLYIKTKKSNDAIITYCSILSILYCG
jgi:hypothetical protein